MAQWWNKKYEYKIWSTLWVFLKEVEDLETKAAAQENLRRKPAQQGSQTGVPTRNGRIYYACGLCQLTCPNEHWLRLHFKGKKHADRMQQGEDDGRRTAVRYAGITTSGDLVISPQAYHCSLCNITCSGKKNLIMHFKGRKHQARMDEVSDDEEDEEDLQSVPSKPAVHSTPIFPSRPHFPSQPAVHSTPIFPSRPHFPSQPAFPPQPTSLCTQDWRFQMKSTTRGLANLSMG